MLDDSETSPLPENPSNRTHDLHPTVERYTLDLESDLGRGQPYLQGGMGRVYRAVNEYGKTVAIKVPRPGAGDVLGALWEREYSEAARLPDHDNVVTVYDLTWATWPDGRRERALVMEWLAGAQSLDEYASGEKLDKMARVDLVRQAACGIAHVHSYSRAHGDVKPANLLAVRRASEHCVKVTDFGGIRRTDRLDTATPVWTTFYVSPEQFAGDRGAIDAQSDAYALGRVLLQLVCGDTALRDSADPSVETQPDSARWLGVRDERLDRIIGDATRLKPSSRCSVSQLEIALSKYRPPFIESALVAFGRFLWPTTNSTARPSGRARRALGVLVLCSVLVLLADWLCVTMHVNGLGPKFSTTPPTPTAFPNVTVIRIKTTSDMAKLANELGIGGVSNDEPASFRLLWERVIDRLIELRATVIALDIAPVELPDASLNRALVDACKRALDAGIPVVVATDSRESDSARPPDLPKLLDIPGTERGYWKFPPVEAEGVSLVETQASPTSTPALTFATRVVAAVVAGKAEYHVALDEAARALRIQVPSPLHGRTIPMEKIAPIDRALVKDPADFGASVGDLAAWYVFGVAADSAFAPIDIAIEDFLGSKRAQSGSELTGRVVGRVVLLANNFDKNGNQQPDDNTEHENKGEDYLTVDGRLHVPGVLLHASAIQAILSGLSALSVGWDVTIAQFLATVSALILAWRATLATLRKRAISFVPDFDAQSDSPREKAQSLARLSAWLLVGFVMIVASAGAIAHITAAPLPWSAGLVLASAILGAFAGLALALLAAWIAAARRANCMSIV